MHFFVLSTRDSCPGYPTMFIHLESRLPIEIVCALGISTCTGSGSFSKVPYRYRTVPYRTSLRVRYVMFTVENRASERLVPGSVVK
jgi:hypothetical protein